MRFRIRYSAGMWYVWDPEDELNQYDKISDNFIEYYTDDQLRQLAQPHQSLSSSYMYDNMVSAINYPLKIPILKREKLYNPYKRLLESVSDTISNTTPIKRKYTRKRKSASAVNTKPISKTVSKAKSMTKPTPKVKAKVKAKAKAKTKANVKSLTRPKVNATHITKTKPKATSVTKFKVKPAAKPKNIQKNKNLDFIIKKIKSNLTCQTSTPI